MNEITPMLRTESLTKRFGGLLAVNAVTLVVDRLGVHCVIGPNGAGKSTLFHLVSGLVRPDSGRVEFDGRDITRWSLEAVSRLGLVRSFQTPRVFTTLTVGDNLRLAAATRRQSEEQLQSHLERFGLLVAPKTPTSALGHGQRKRLELALAVACQPKLLLLDEPTAGMNAQETEELEKVIREVAERTTIVVIEHDIDFVRRMADRLSVLHRGSLIREGTVAEIESDAVVRRVYLGESP